MASKKKRKGRKAGQKNPQKKADVFNPAFRELASLKQKEQGAQKEDQKKKPSRPKRGPDETRIFMEAMRGVTPLMDAKSLVTRPSNMDMRPRHAARSDEEAGLAHLSDLVSGAIEMDITFSDEYIEGCVRGFDQKLMQRLKRGQFSIQDYVDLHGLTKEEAEVRIRDFLLQSHRSGFRCVLVVHGRGLNSENHIPVLKERIPVWLSRGPVRKMVLAFSTARSYDGGTGAIYILLKRPKGRA